jgi:hypothetical protein
MLNYQAESSHRIDSMHIFMPSVPRLTGDDPMMVSYATTPVPSSRSKHCNKKAQSFTRTSTKKLTSFGLLVERSCNHLIRNNLKFGHVHAQKRPVPTNYYNGLFVSEVFAMV